MSFKTFPRSAIALALCGISGPLLAQVVPPDSGQLLRELQQTAPRALSNTQAPRRVDETESAGPASNEMIEVKSITITGNQELTTAELLPLLAGLEGKEQPLSRLQAAGPPHHPLLPREGLCRRACLPAGAERDRWPRDHCHHRRAHCQPQGQQPVAAV